MIGWPERKQIMDFSARKGYLYVKPWKYCTIGQQAKKLDSPPRDLGAMRGYFEAT